MKSVQSIYKEKDIFIKTEVCKNIYKYLLTEYSNTYFKSFKNKYLYLYLNTFKSYFYKTGSCYNISVLLLIIILLAIIIYSFLIL